MFSFSKIHPTLLRSHIVRVVLDYMDMTMPTLTWQWLRGYDNAYINMIMTTWTWQWLCGHDNDFADMTMTTRHDNDYIKMTMTTLKWQWLHGDANGYMDMPMTTLTWQWHLKIGGYQRLNFRTSKCLMCNFASEYLRENKKVKNILLPVRKWPKWSVLSNWGIENQVTLSF